MKYEPHLVFSFYKCPISLMERIQGYELWDEGSIPLWGNEVNKWLVRSRLIILDIERNAVVAFLQLGVAYAPRTS